MPSHMFTGVYNGAKFEIEFGDKRSYNSFVNNIEKAKNITISYDANVCLPVPSTPKKVLDDFKVIEKNGHICLIPPNDVKEDIEITPTFEYDWSPVLKGNYWNDGKYRFYPKKSQIKVNLSCEDIIRNLVENGAKYDGELENIECPPAKKPRGTPNALKDFKIINKYDSVTLVPPTKTKENIEIVPTFQYTWSTTLKGKYWNDGMYHFFPKNSCMRVGVTADDIVQNMKDNGAEM